MIHQRQGLPLGLEAGDHLARIHARLDELQRYLAAHRMMLLGDKHQAHAPFADLLHQLVRTDRGAGPFAHGLVERGGRLMSGRFEKAPHFVMMHQELLHFAAQRLIAGAMRGQVFPPTLSRGNFQGSQKDRFGLFCLRAHESGSGHMPVCNTVR
jgi:hypothetical protein